MAAWRRLPSPARGGLIAAVSAVFGAAAAILVSASGLVDSQIPDVTDPAAAPSTVTVTAAPQASDPAAGLEPVPPAPKDRFGDSPPGKPWTVGVDVLAGVYRSPSPQDGEVCTWVRERMDSAPEPTLRSTGRTPRGSSEMSLRKGDLLTTDGCEEWTWQRAK